jgi:hypothetical protein
MIYNYINITKWTATFHTKKVHKKDHVGIQALAWDRHIIGVELWKAVPTDVI